MKLFQWKAHIVINFASADGSSSWSSCQNLLG